jgi:hypothetical protein
MHCAAKEAGGDEEAEAVESNGPTKVFIGDRFWANYV